MKNKKIKFFKIAMAIVILAICLGLIIYLFPVIRNISTPEGQQKFKSKITNSGIAGFFILFGLEIAQIFLAILPGEPLEILAGMCYGGFFGTIFLMFSVFITTTIIFLAVRKYGKEFIYNFCNKEKIDKIENRIYINNIIYDTRNTKRFVGIYRRITSNKSIKICSNFNICKIPINNNINTCRSKYHER